MSRCAVQLQNCFAPTAKKAASSMSSMRNSLTLS